MSDPRGRVHPRFAVDWRVELRCPDWGVVSRACASNASRGGIFILTSRPPAVGAPVEVVLSLPDGSKVELRGTVQHVVTPERAVAEGKSAGIGVRLDERHAVDLLVLEHMAEAAEGTVDVPLDDLGETPPPPVPSSQPVRPVVGKINLVASVPPARVVGIDFGSSVTRLAFAAGDRVQLAAALPSLVAFPDEGEPLVGRAALDDAPDDPRRTVARVKRLIGRPFGEPHATDLRRAAAFATAPADDGGIELDLGASRRPLADVAALILQAAREQAEKQLRRPVGEAVVAVPAELGEPERAALRAAAGRAGSAAPAACWRGRLAAPALEDQLVGGRREGEGPDVLPGPHGASRQVAQFDATRGNRAARAAEPALARLRGAGGRWWGGRFRGRRRARSAPAGTCPLRRARVHLVRHPLRIGRETGISGVGHRHFRARLEVQQVQDRLRLGLDRVRQRQRVHQPCPVAGQLLARDASPLGVVVYREGLLRSRLRGRGCGRLGLGSGLRLGGRLRRGLRGGPGPHRPEDHDERERQRDRDRRPTTTRAEGCRKRDVHVDSFVVVASGRRMRPG
jgi:Tfp pilus assembly protein PilZ